MLVLNHAAAEAWQPAAGDRLQERAANAIDRVRAKVERSHPYFEDAYAVAVWPGITRIAAGFGGAYGKGKVYQGGKLTGDASLVKVSVGFQAGGQAFSEIIFFQDKRAYDEFTSGDFAFDGPLGFYVMN